MGQLTTDQVPSTTISNKISRNQLLHLPWQRNEYQGRVLLSYPVPPGFLVGQPSTRGIVQTDDSKSQWLMILTLTALKHYNYNFESSFGIVPKPILTLNHDHRIDLGSTKRSTTTIPLKTHYTQSPKRFWTAAQQWCWDSRATFQRLCQVVRRVNRPADSDGAPAEWAMAARCWCGFRIIFRTKIGTLDHFRIIFWRNFGVVSHKNSLAMLWSAL